VIEMWRIGLILAISQVPFSQGQEVLYAAPGSNLSEYLVTLKASPDWMTPTDHYRRSSPRRENREALLHQLSVAQSHFVSGALTNAEAEFQTLTEMTTMDDWAAADRETLLYGYLRLAQLASSASQRDQHLSRALMLGSGLKVDRTLIPPPIMERLEALRREVPKRKWLQDLPTSWSAVLINGAACTLESCHEVPRLPYPVRITFLSDQWLPQSRVLTGTEDWRPAEVPWVHGNCQHPEFAQTPSRGRATRRMAFFDLNCEREKRASLYNFKPSPLPIVQDEVRPPLDTTTTRTTKAFYKSKWFYVGIGAVTITALVLFNQKERERRDPSTTYGL